MAWLAFDNDERGDTERVGVLEETARSAEPATAVRLLAEADELRAKWNQPRSGQRFSTLSEIVEELQSIRPCGAGAGRDGPGRYERSRRPRDYGRPRDSPAPAMSFKQAAEDAWDYVSGLYPAPADEA